MANQAAYPVQTMCRVLEVSTSGYYAWVDRPPSARAIDDAVMVERIRAVHAESDMTYGMPRVRAELVDQGVRISRKRVARLMRRHGIRGVSRRRGFVVTTRRDETHRRAPDLVNRRFVADRPNQLWVADITYVPTWAGFIFLAVVLDVWSRRVVGWSIGEQITAELVLAALNMALEQRRPEEVIHHSDQGSQPEFNWSSQQILIGGCDGYPKASDWSCQDEVAGATSRPTSISASAVLAGDRRWSFERRSGSNGQGVTSGRNEMVSGVWRYAAITSVAVVAATDRTVLVDSRARTNCFAACSASRCARDRAAARTIPVDDLSGTATQRGHPKRRLRVSSDYGAVACRSGSATS
jgi:integrase-like protein/helix-turn-helix protein